MSIAKQEFTNAGRSMLGRAQNGETLTISKIVVGSGIATQASELWPLTALIAQEMNVTISSKNDDGNGQLLIEGIFRSDAAPHAFDLREVGVMAHIGAEADRLYSVANAFADPPDHIDPAAPTFYGYKIKLVVDRIPAASLVIQIGPTEAVMGENVGLGTVGPGPYKEAVGNVLRFKRFKGQGGTTVTEDTGQNVITIGVPMLTQNVDLYVPASYVSPPPGTLPEQFFPTIQAAHDYLLTFRIPADKTATIHVDAGTFAKANFSHPDSKQMKLIGRPRVDKAISVINWLDNTATAGPPIDTVQVGGSSGHKNIALVNSADVSAFQVGQIVYIRRANWGWVGGCKITAIAGAVITCDVPDQSDQTRHFTAQSTVASFPNQTLSYYPTIVQWTNPNPGARPLEHCLSFPNGIGSVENILAVGGHNAFGAGADLNLTNCMAWNAIAGCASFTGTCTTVGDYTATHCEQGSGGPGILWHLGTDTTGATYINGCQYGIVPGYNGCAVAAINTAMTGYWCFVNHCSYGIRCGLNCSAYGSQVIYMVNDVGMYAELNGALNFAILGNFPQLNGTDLYATRGSYICYRLGGGPAPTLNPASNPGNNNSWIETLT
jgi:hypothetical protein